MQGGGRQQAVRGEFAGQGAESRLTGPGPGATSPAHRMWPADRAGRIDAQMAELVDAQVSGTCGRKVVEVRVFFWAPFFAAGGREQQSGAR